MARTFVGQARLNEPITGFQRGEVFWYSVGTRPNRGDWIYYRQTPLTTSAGMNRNIRLQGALIGEVIGLEGDWITPDYQVVRVRTKQEGADESAERQEQGLRQVAVGFVAIRPPQSIGRLVMPSALQGQMTFVPETSVDGVILLRTWPWTRWRFF